MENGHLKPLLPTFSGKLIDVTRIKAEDINAYDIAYALSNYNRFAGHTAPAWDVLSHTGLVYILYLQDVKGVIDDNVALALLLHDAAKAYIGDMIGGLKRCAEFGQLFKQLEEYVISVIYERFNIKPIDQDIINRYDWQAAHLEMEKFFPEHAAADGVAKSTYQLTSRPIFVKAKVGDFIETIRHMAINANVDNIQRLFELPEGKLALVQQDNSQAQASRDRSEYESSKHTVDNSGVERLTV